MEKFRDPKKTCSRIGLALVVFLAVSSLMGTLLIVVLGLLNVSVLDNPWTMWLVNDIPIYLIGLPVFLLILKTIPDGEEPERTPMRMNIGRLLLLIVFCLGATYFLNIIGGLIVTFIDFLMKGDGVQGPIDDLISDSNILSNFIFGAIIPPLGEEFIFRYSLRKKMKGAPDIAYILISGICFGAFHMNIVQFLYASVLGMAFAWIYLKTNKIIYPILLHFIVNFMGIMVVPQLLSNDTGLLIYGIAMLVLIVAAIILFFVFFKRVKNGLQPATAFGWPGSQWAYGFNNTSASMANHNGVPFGTAEKNDLKNQQGKAQVGVIYAFTNVLDNPNGRMSFDNMVASDSTKGINTYDINKEYCENTRKDSSAGTTGKVENPDYSQAARSYQEQSLAQNYTPQQPSYHVPPQPQGYATLQASYYAQAQQQGYSTPQASYYGQAQQQGYSTPQASYYGQAQQQGYPTPQASYYGQAQQQGYPTPQASYYGQPQQQGYPTPQASYYGQPQQQCHPTPQASHYGQPQQQGYPTPQASYYGQPQQQGYPTPQASYYGQPQQQGYPTPQASYYGQPQQQGYPTPQASYYGQPRQQGYQISQANYYGQSTLSYGTNQYSPMSSTGMQLNPPDFFSAFANGSVKSIAKVCFLNGGMIGYSIFTAIFIILSLFTL